MWFVFYVLILLMLHGLIPYWWWVMVVPLVFFMVWKRGPWKSLMLAGSGGGLVWLGYSVYTYLGGGQIIASRMADMMGIRPSWLLIIVTGLVGFIAAAVAGLSGYFIRQAMDYRQGK